MEDRTAAHTCMQLFLFFSFLPFLPFFGFVDAEAAIMVLSFLKVLSVDLEEVCRSGITVVCFGTGCMSCTEYLNL